MKGKSARLSGQRTSKNEMNNDNGHYLYKEPQNEEIDHFPGEPQLRPQTYPTSNYSFAEDQATAILRLLTCRNYKIIDMCCFHLLILW